MNILTLNIGSSSIKYQLFDAKLQSLLADNIENQQQSITHLAQKLTKFNISKVCHRVVHGGNKFFEPCVVNQQVLDEIAKLAALAPLHNPLQHQGIITAMAQFTEAQHIAFFDTAFHQTMPESQTLVPIANNPEVRKYGFHGLNYAYINDLLTTKFARPVNAIICHLGNGASVCAIKNGKSYATSMGMTPNAGLIMGTRSGDIDAGIITYLANKHNLTIAEIDNMLNKESGLLGICGYSDMRACEQSDSKSAKLALLAYAERVKFYIGGYLALLGKIDCLVFTAGIGENSAYMRNLILDGMQKFDTYVIPANEEKYMASWANNMLK